MKKYLSIISLFLGTLSANAQFVPVTDHYVLNPLILNPAFAGHRGSLSVAAFYRSQWTGINGSPVTTTLSIDAPLPNDRLGLGFIVVTDKIGVTKETQYISNYAYKINLNDGTLSFGLAAGLTTTNTKWSDLIALDPGDNYLLIDHRRYAVPNFGFGTYYTYRDFWAGFSIPRFFGYRFNFEKGRYNIVNDPRQYTYMLTSGYLFKLSSGINLHSSTLISYSATENVQFDLNAHLNLKNNLWFGVGYRSKRALTGLFQIQINNQLKAAYSYDFNLANLGRYSGGTHEIMFRYEFTYKVDAVNPLIF
jgi:type IX secretion system PorP/SprF family membrane protein